MAAIYWVGSGCVQLRRTDEGGGVAVMQRGEAGMLLAESSIFSDHYHCDAVVVADAELIAVRRADLKRLMLDDPAVLEALARYLAREVQRSRVRLELLGRKTVRERFDAWLVLNNGVWPPRGAMARAAQEIGVTPEALYREARRRAGLRRS